MLNLLKSSRGITIIEVIVSAAMTMIVAVGIATMMTNSAQEQRKIILLDVLKNQKAKFEYVIRDQASWTVTLNSSANSAAIFTSLRNSSAVSTVGASYASPVKIALFDAAGYASMTTFLGPGETFGDGLTEKGAFCNTFSTVAGTDNCPISYRVMMGADCTGVSTSCANPQLKIVARLLYNPSSSGTLRNFANMIQAITGTDISDTVADGKYDASVKRTSASTNRSFRLYTSIASPAAGCATAGAGTCSTNIVAPIGAVHPQNWIEDYDTNSLVTASGTQNITFGETGYYSCTIAVPAFATTGFTARLRNTTGGSDIATASTTAGLWTQGMAVIDAKFNVTSTSDVYQVWQKCDALPGGSPSANNCTLGLATVYTVPATIMSMSCSKLDRSM